VTEEISKSFYSIGEVAAMLNVAPSLIRFWEKEFDILAPAKTQGGTRKFSREDIDHLRLIHHLVKEKGFTLQGARDSIKNASRLRDEAAAISALKNLRSFLTDLKVQLDKHHPA
jgi:DNA-binding transcriptional MerR regulator